MNAIDVIKLSLENSRGWTMGLFMDIKDQPMVQATSSGGNHPMWLLGHIVHSESNLLDGFIQGKPNRFPELESNFAMGTSPSTDASEYPSMDELFAIWDEVRAATIEYLNSLSDADLDKPSHAPEAFSPGFATVGGCFTGICIHASFHAGQVADCRRAAGRTPLFAAPVTAE